MGAQAGIVLLVATGAPFELRLPVGLLYALTVPGFAVIGLLRLDDPMTELTLSLAMSIALVTAVAQSLVWLNLYSLTTALGTLTLLSTSLLAAQLRLDGRRTDTAGDSSGPRSMRP